MDVIAAWCGFVGAWVLVAGPLYQGTVELRWTEVDHASIRSQAKTIPRPKLVSPWWWLLPPVAYLMSHRNTRAWQLQVLASLTPEQRSQFVAFSNKSAGWFLVGAGATLIGIQQAVGLVETLGWPSLATIPLVAVAAAASLTFTVRRLLASQRALHAGDAAE